MLYEVITYEILVVNNGGLSHSERVLKPLLAPWGDRIRLVEAGGNRGYAGGCRLGVESARGELFVFHNDDAIADPAMDLMAGS